MVKVCEFYFFLDCVFVDEVLCLGLINWVCELGEFVEKIREIVEWLVFGLMIVYCYMKENFN